MTVCRFTNLQGNKTSPNQKEITSAVCRFTNLQGNKTTDNINNRIITVYRFTKCDSRTEMKQLKEKIGVHNFSVGFGIEVYLF